MEEDIRLLIKLIDSNYYECLVDYISIPNHPNSSYTVHLLLVKHGNQKVKFISEALEVIRVKHNVTYNNLQSAVRSIIAK